jgi:glyoxylase I family protein
MLQKLHHVAYRCRDAAETVEFYTKVIGLKFSHAITADSVPSTREYSPHFHIFFEMADGSSIAFFEVPKSPPAAKDPNTPDWVQHLALEVKDEAALAEGKRRLTAAGYDVVGPTDHGFCRSIYFRDPNGYIVELAANTGTHEEIMDPMRSKPHEALARWQAAKQSRPAA